MRDPFFYVLVLLYREIFPKDVHDFYRIFLEGAPCI